MGDIAFIAFLALVVILLFGAAKSESTENTNFRNQCIEAGGNPVKLAKQGNICLKDATQIPLIIKVL
jgi:hypothetical protein